MNLSEKLQYGKGSIKVMQGDSLVCCKDNLITYRAADMMASMIAGEETVVPRYIGFVYAASNAVLQNPADKVPKRRHTLDTIRSTVESASGNMIVSPISSTVTEVVGSSDDYNGNAVTVSAMSDDSDPLFTGTGVRTSKPSSTDSIFQVVLLGKSSQGEYVPFAYAALKDDGSGINVVGGANLAVFWTLKFV